MRSDSPVCVFLGVVLVSLCFVGTVDATPQIEFVVPTPTNGYRIAIPPGGSVEINVTINTSVLKCPFGKRV